MIKHPFRLGLVAAVVAGGIAAVVPAGISAASTVTFTQAQQKLEQQLASRTTELSRLTADVSGSKTLTTSDASTLQSRLTAETQSIAALVAKVPNDTTGAQLRADAHTMYYANRVYAVMLPQVLEIIEADALAPQVTTDQANESALAASVSSLAGQPGYQAAENRYQSFVRQVGTAANVTAKVSAAVLPQLPADFPRDGHVFRTAGHELLNVDIALARASYEETLIGLGTAS